MLYNRSADPGCTASGLRSERRGCGPFTPADGCKYRSPGAHEHAGKPDVPETPAAPEPAAAPQSEITQEMAYVGVNNYCHITYSWSIAEEIPDIMYVVNWDETETEYVVMFRSYTGAYAYFYVDKASGVTKIMWHDPTLNTDSDGGTINIWDYLETGG